MNNIANYNANPIHNHVQNSSSKNGRYFTKTTSQTHKSIFSWLCNKNQILEKKKLKKALTVERDKNILKKLLKHMLQN